jgi:hypothetical protein
MTKSRGPKPPPEWDEGFTRNSQIPEYRAYNDVYAQNYFGHPRKPGNYGKFLDNAKNIGGIRQKSLIYSNRTEYGPPPPANNPRHASIKRAQGPPGSGHAFSNSKRASHHESLSVSSQKGTQ